MMTRILTRLGLLPPALLMTTALIACGDDDSGATEVPKVPDTSVAAMEDLPNCTEKREGETALVAEDNSTYECKSGTWALVPVPTLTVESLDDLLNCTAKADGDTVIVEAENAMFRCDDGEWKKIRAFTDTLASVDDLLACVAKREGNSTYITEEHALYRCDDGSWEKTISFIDTVKTKDDLSNCTGEKEGDSTYVSKENAVYLCIDKDWLYLGDATESSDDLPNCSEKREGDKAFIEKEHVTLICSDGKWLRYDIYKIIDTEDESEVSSSSKDRDDFKASSSSVIPNSSSSETNVSSSSAKSSSSSIGLSSSSVVQSSSSIILATPCKSEIEDNCEYGTLTDDRDGQTYKTVKIGSQIWMAENLNYETANSYCYRDSAKYCTKYGRYYTWSEAMDSVGTWSINGKGCGDGKVCSPTYPVYGVCPKSWHLPSYTEWNTLFIAVGGPQIAGKVLKSTTGWNSSDNGTDAFGFSALPAGARMYQSADKREFNFFGEGDVSYFWYSTELNSDYAGTMYLYYKLDYADLGSDTKYLGFSVRCLQD